MNGQLLLSDATHFRISYEINPYMHLAEQPDRDAAVNEHRAIAAAHRDAGRELAYMPGVPDCPDMVFAANAALVRGNRAVMGRPPERRRAEIPHFRNWLAAHGYEIVDAPFAFGGQGDALPFGNLLLAGHGRRTDRRTHALLEEFLGYDLVPLHTTGDDWFDIDLAVAVIRNPSLLAYCPTAFDRASRQLLRELPVDLIEVSAEEAGHFALNLISDGATVTMPTGAPRLAAELRDRGLRTVELDTTELRKGGGGIRCTALTLDNPAPRSRR